VEVDVMTSATDLTLEVIGGTQRRNTAHKGGSTALLNFGERSDTTVVAVANVTFVDNTCHRSGGALALQMQCAALGLSVFTVSGCIFDGNVASVNGGGVWTDFKLDVPSRGSATGSGSGDATSLGACPQSDYR
jgi:hypothetical protein